VTWKRIELDELIGQRVVGAILRGGVQLTIGEGVEHTLRIESPFTVQNDAGFVVCGASRDVDLPTGLGRIGSTLGSRVVDAVAEGDGSLRMTFSNGESLVVPVDEDFEAWTLTGPEGTLASPPGGPSAT
jgi:hypothetical protein